MKTTTITIATLLLFAAALVANEKAVDASRSHVRAVLRADYTGLEGSYASRVVLMPGHEFLKAEYGLAADPERNRATVVERAKLVEAMRKGAIGRSVRPDDRIAALMESLQFKVLEAAAGDFATPPADPVGTPDSKLHFTIRQGDVLVKAGPPEGDFILLQMRQVDGTWRVVAEYLD